MYAATVSITKWLCKGCSDFIPAEEMPWEISLTGPYCKVCARNADLTGPKQAVVLTDKHFIDWESDVFGYGYGTGEAPVLECLHFFFKSLTNYTMYDFRVLEEELKPAAAWLLINTLCHARIITYGSSPRFGFLEPDEGVYALRNYVLSKTPEQLYEIVTGTDNNYVRCLREYCNCDVPCNNPLFAPPPWKSGGK